MSERILIVDDDAGLRESLELVLSAEGYEVLAAENAETALRIVDQAPVEVVLCDLRMPGMDGLELLPQLVRRLPGATVLMMSAYGSADLAIEAMKRGAYDYLAKPFQPSEVLFTLRKTRERERLRRENQLLRRDVQRAVGDRPIVASSGPMIELLEVMERAAAFKSTVLLTGESGTGKEVLARAIHAQSPRRNETFVAINCGAIPEALLESELFGHAKGAFTGADRERKGLFEAADGGTLFLDEVSETSGPFQAKLLRALQEREVRPLGGARARPVDVRVVAASNRDLWQEAEAHGFRQDLYYRLAVFPVHVPPLRDRPGDVPRLAEHFLTLHGDAPGGLSPGAVRLLQSYRWPGNVRELENEIQRALALADPGEVLAPIHFSRRVRGLLDPIEANLRPGDTLRETLDRIEAWLLRRALETHGNRRAATARRLGITREGLYKKLKRLGIE